VHPVDRYLSGDGELSWDFTDTKLRDQAHELAKEKPEEALQLVEQITDSWFGTQALASIGYHADASIATQILQRAVALSGNASDPYKRAAVLAWPMSAYFERGDKASGRATLRNGVERLDAIKHPASKSEAIRHLVESALPHVPLSELAMLLDALIAAVESNHWRAKLNSLRVAQLIGHTHPSDARQFAERIPDEKSRAKALRRIDVCDFTQPRTYF